MDPLRSSDMGRSVADDPEVWLDVNALNGANMYGHRARIAHLAPSRGDVMVYEFYQLAPRGTMLINTTGTIRKLRKDDIEMQLQQLERAAQDVAAEQVDLIIAGGGPLVTSQGFGSAERIAARLSDSCGVRCVTSIEFQVDALKAVGSQRPVIASPYPPELDQQLVEYLGQAGFDVQGSKGLGIVSNSQIGLLPEDASLECGRSAAAMAPDADAILMPCARWPTLSAIPQLEQEFDVPVISANNSSFHGAFSLLGVYGDFGGRGTLMEKLSRE